MARYHGPLMQFYRIQRERFEHPDYKHRVDVVAVPVQPQKQISDGCRVDILNVVRGLDQDTSTLHWMIYLPFVILGAEQEAVAVLLCQPIRDIALLLNQE